MTWPELTTAEVRALAPDAIDAFETAMGSAEALARRAPVVELARRSIVSRLSGDAATAIPDASLSDDERVCLEFAEQFVLDVSRISDDDRARLGAVLGRDTFEFVQALYAFDQGWRLARVTQQLFEVSAISPASTDLELWPALERMMTAVVILDRLDPLASELVRLRGARAHHCRVCMSRRLAPVMASGRGTLLEQAEIEALTEAGEPALAALRLTDAIVWQPRDVPQDVLEAVRASFEPAAALEIVLDVTRNASNKIAVALGADQATVSDGVESFEISPSGDYTYGLPTP